MRILAVSDTHGDFASMRQAVLAQPTAQVVIHLGDGEREAQDLKRLFPDKAFLQVRGNCDWGSSLPLEECVALEGVKILYTHGHIYNVKYGLYELKAAAREKKAQVALFGHTHRPLEEYEDGLYLLNPGSLRAPDGSYGFIDLTPAGVVTGLVRL